MSFTIDKFLREVKENDKVIRIYNDNDDIAHVINPFSVLRIFVSRSNINMTLSGNRNVVLDFRNITEARNSLSKLQQTIDLLRQKKPASVDIETEKYIENVVGNEVTDYSQLYDSIRTGSSTSGTSGSSGTAGTSGSSGTAGTSGSSGTAGTGGTSSSEKKTIDNSLQKLVSIISEDIKAIDNKKKITIKLNPNGYYDDNVNRHLKVVDYKFTHESEGAIDLFINGLMLNIDKSESSIAYFSRDNQMIDDFISESSNLYINPYLLGYYLDQSDTITIRYTTAL
jgi:hypothetical protein